MKNSLMHLFFCSVLLIFFAACGDNTRKPANDSNAENNDNESSDTGDEELSDDIEEGICGNDNVELSEVCDGGLKDCTKINPALYISGKAKCKEDCTDWDVITCVETDAECGNEILEVPEACDSDLKDCVDIDSSKYKGGKAKCNNNCDAYDTVTCEELDEVAVCGDDLVEGNEVCEKETMTDCVDIDSSLYKGGKAYCLDDCTGWDTITCEENIGILFSDGFENGSDKWILGGDWEIGLPYYDIGGVTLTEAATEDGVLATKLTDGYTIKVNSTATVAEDIVIPETGSYTLTFSAYVNTDFDVPSENGDANWFDGMIVTSKSGLDAEENLAIISEDPGLAGSFKALVGETDYDIKTGVRGTSANNTYSDFSVDLSSLAGKTVTINFVFYSDTIQGGTGAFPGIYIDDVLIAKE